MQTYSPGPPLIPAIWFKYEIAVQGDDYTVFLTSTQAGERHRTTFCRNTDAERGRSLGFIGVQVYAGNAVPWRHIRVMTQEQVRPSVRTLGARSDHQHHEQAGNDTMGVLQHR